MVERGAFNHVVEGSIPSGRGQIFFKKKVENFGFDEKEVLGYDEVTSRFWPDYVDGKKVKVFICCINSLPQKWDVRRWASAVWLAESPEVLDRMNAKFCESTGAYTLPELQVSFKIS